MDHSTRWLRGGLTAAAVGALSLGTSAGGAAAQTATPRWYATPACTETRQYEVDLHIADFPPNEDFRLLFSFTTDDDQVTVDFPPDIRTNASGDADQAGITLEGDEPHRIGGRWYRDSDGNNRWNEGEDVIADLVMSIDRRCTGAEAVPK